MTQQTAIPQTLRYFSTTESFVKRPCALPHLSRYRSLRWLWAGAALCFALLAGALPARAADVWQNVGNPGFSQGQADYTSMALDATGRPYVAYQDGGNSGKATVMRLDAAGSGWEVVGNAQFSAGPAAYMSLAFNSTGRLYLAYQDRTGSFRPTVMRLNDAGTAWEVVGTARFGTGNPNYLSLVFDSNDRPYVAFRDQGEYYRATVMRLKDNGLGWETVGGGAGFTAGGTSYTSLALDLANRPYVAYIDNDNSDKAMVMRLNATGTGWELVGGGALSVEWSAQTSLALDATGRPYVAYQDGDTLWGKATVKRLNGAGTGWEVVGTAEFSAADAPHLILALDSGDRPYVAYMDAGNGYKTTVMRLKSDNTWEGVGAAGFSAGSSSYISLVLDAHDRPYVAYKVYEDGKRASVMRLLATPGAPTAATVTVGSKGSGQVTVSWQAPTEDGGSAVLSYTATANPGGASCQATAPATSCVITGLTNGQTYTFSVTATNAQGASLASAASAAATPASLTSTAQAVPTLNAWVLALLALALAALSALALRRNGAAHSAVGLV